MAKIVDSEPDHLSSNLGLSFISCVNLGNFLNFLMPQVFYEKIIMI